MKPETFGQMVARLRAEKGLAQRELAQKASGRKKNSVSPSSVAHIERGSEKLSHEMCMRVVDALEPDKKTRKELVAALDAWIEARPAAAVNYPNFGRVLSAIISDHQINQSVMAKAVGATASFVQYMRSGAKMPGAALFREVMKYLKGRGVSEDSIKELEWAYVYDAVYDSPRLQYLSVGRRKEVADAAADAAADAL